MFDLDFLRSQQDILLRYSHESLFLTFVLFLLLYFFSSATFLPITTILSIAGGLLFGFWGGVGTVLVAAVVGSSIAFFIGRYLFQDFFQAKFERKLVQINREMNEYGGFYVFMLRQLPGVPFSLTNILMALSPIRFRSFLIFSSLGLIPRTLIYVNAGTRLRELESVQDILSIEWIVTLCLLGFFPVFCRWAFSTRFGQRFLRNRKRS